MSKVGSCRSCGSSDLRVVLSLGCTPLANALLSASQLDEPEDFLPLDLSFCPSCSLLQFLDTVPPERLFRHYLYFSSFSDTVLRQAEQIASHMIQSRQLAGESLVVEIGSNDGYLLQYYRKRGIRVLGIEPAVNVARVAEAEHGVRTLSTMKIRVMPRATIRLSSVAAAGTFCFLTTMPCWSPTRLNV